MRARLVVLAALAPAVASAQSARDLTAVCEAPAPEDREACGAYYVDRYGKNPGARDGDELLYNAGVLFYEGHAVSAALNAWSQLRRSYPNSKLAPRAIARMAKVYGDVAMYDKAAELLEEYAKKYAGEKDAYDAMSDAIYYRRAIGDHDRAIENTRYFIKTYGTKRPDVAAHAHFALASIYETRRDTDAVRKHLRDYIRLYGRKGGEDKLVMAYSKLGLLAWEASCPVKPIDGACVKIVRAKQPNVCSGARVRFEAVKRDGKEVKAALELLGDAIKRYERLGGTTGGDETGARYFYAKALLAKADHDADAHLATVVARGPTLDAWLEDEVTRRGKLVATYEAVLAIKDAATSITAAARIGQLVDTLATALGAAGTTKDECTRLAAEAAPYKSRAVTAYGVCLGKANELGWFDEHGARICERGLERLDLQAFPRLREVTQAASFAPAVTATELLWPE